MQAIPAPEYSAVTDIAFRTVAAGRGAAWLAEGFGLFRQAPLLWIGMLLLWLVGMAVVSALPVLGGLAVNLSSAIVLGGLLLGAREQAEGRPLQLDTLWAGFRPPQMQPLLLLGVAYLVIGVAIILLAVVLVLVLVGKSGLSGNLMNLEFGRGVAVAALLLLPVIVLASLAVWLAPALVVFRQARVVDALKLSFGAGLANLGALTVYGLLTIGIVLAAMVPFGLGLLVALPVLVASSYCCYRDLFEAGPGEPLVR